MPSSRNSSEQDEQGGIQPRYRRAFGCVTWVYMSTLAFLAVSSLLLMPFWYFGDWNVFSILEGFAFFATLLFLPAIALGAILGARTYRAARNLATRTGAAVGAVVGWMGYAFLAWSERLTRQDGGAGLALYAFVPLAVLASILVLYALFAGRRDFGFRKRLVAAAAVTAAFSGIALLAADFGALEVASAGVCTVSGAAAGWVAGFGYARAGGREMLPEKAGG